MWDATPVTDTRTDSGKVEQYSVWVESAINLNEKWKLTSASYCNNPGASAGSRQSQALDAGHYDGKSQSSLNRRIYEDHYIFLCSNLDLSSTLGSSRKALTKIESFLFFLWKWEQISPCRFHQLNGDSIVSPKIFDYRAWLSQPNECFFRCTGYMLIIQLAK